MKRILVIGCGLIGTSFAMALARYPSEFEVHGTDSNLRHLQIALQTSAFQQVFTTTEQLQSGYYDVVVLAIPVRAACSFLLRALELAPIVFDVCSVKTSICATAKQSPEWERFAPTHPMAGKSEEGPQGASETLFENKPWLYIDGWPATLQVLPIILKTGAIPIRLDSQHMHDTAMATVSHGIHLVSLAAMSAYGRAVQETGQMYAHLSGPGFKDITRLSESPIAFWVETLMENRTAVMHHLLRVKAVLNDFTTALESEDEFRLAELLEEAKKFHEDWQGGREAWHLR